MKKTLALLLALALLCCAASCFAETAEATVLLTLSLQQLSLDGETFMDPASQGIDLAFVLYDNGAVVGANISDAGVLNMVGGWTQDENGNVILAVYPEGASAEDEPETLVLTMQEDGSIVGVDTEGVTYIFGDGAASSQDMPQLVQLEDASALNGTWWFYGLLNGGALITAEELLAQSPETADFLGYDGTDNTMIVADDVVTVFGSTLEGFVFTDGMLVLPLGDEEIDMSVTLGLLDSGDAIFTELGVPMLFVPVQ